MGCSTYMIRLGSPAAGEEEDDHGVAVDPGRVLDSCTQSLVASAPYVAANRTACIPLVSPLSDRNRTLGCPRKFDARDSRATPRSACLRLVAGAAAHSVAFRGPCGDDSEVPAAGLCQLAL